MGCEGSAEQAPKRKVLRKGTAGPVRSAGPPIAEDEDLGFKLDWITYGCKKTSLSELIFARDEFRTLVESEEAMEQVAQQSFVDDDRDEDGAIGKEELCKAIKDMVKECEMEVEVNDKFLDKVYADIDKNGDDEITLDEYKDFCKAALKYMYRVLDQKVYEKMNKQEGADMEAMANGGDLEGHAFWVNLPEDIEELEAMREDVNSVIKDKDTFEMVASEYYEKGDAPEGEPQEGAGDGLINAKELKTVLEKICDDFGEGAKQEIPEVEAKEYLKRFDYNEDQQLQKDEFFDLFKFVMKEIYSEITWAITNAQEE